LPCLIYILGVGIFKHTKGSLLGRLSCAIAVHISDKNLNQPKENHTCTHTQQRERQAHHRLTEKGLKENTRLPKEIWPRTTYYFKASTTARNTKLLTWMYRN
jgi:hypothetical protein